MKHILYLNKTIVNPFIYKNTIYYSFLIFGLHFKCKYNKCNANVFAITGNPACELGGGNGGFVSIIPQCLN